MPGDSGATVVTTLVWFLFFPREAAGAMGTRHSPRPHWGEGYMDNSGVTRRGNADVCAIAQHRRPCESRDPYAVSHVLKDTVRRLSRNNEGLWLWVPAFAGTTVKWLFENRIRANGGRSIRSTSAFCGSTPTPPSPAKSGRGSAPIVRLYRVFSARLSKNTPCSPNMFQNHQGRLTRSGRP